MKKVLIASAAYGGHNVGDDAILYAIIEHLRSLDQDIHITAVTRLATEMSKRLGVETLEFEGYLNRLRTYLAIARADALIVGGGALIAEYTHGWKGLVTGHPGYPMTMLAVAKLLGKKTMVYGAGVEPIKFPVTRFFIRQIFGRADVITVRDEDSRTRLVDDLGVPGARVVTTADPVLGLQPPSTLEMDRFATDLDPNDDARPLVIINFAYGVDQRETLLDFIAQSADHVISNLGARVLFIPMNIQRTADRIGIERVIERMDAPESTSILRLPYAHPEVIALTKKAELVISSRMHLLILAALVCTPILGISRVPKIDAFLARYGLSPGASSDALNFDRFRNKLDETWQTRVEIRNRLEGQRENLARIAQSNAQLFNEIL